MQENLHHHHHHLLLLFLFPFLLHLPTVESEITKIKITSDDRPFILFQDFGFTNPGYISVNISSVSIASPRSILNPTKFSLMGCFYAPTPARQAMTAALMKNLCIMGKPFIFPIFTLNARKVFTHSYFNRTIPVTIPDLYYVFFLNCAKNTTITMDVSLETYNLHNNGQPDYIDEHLANLPTTLFIFSMLFLVLFLIWSYVCGKNKHFIRKIHILMAVLLFSRFLELIFYAESQHSIRQTGSPHNWNIVWLTMYFVKNILYVTTIMLLGSGWTLFRPPLLELEKCTMVITVFFQVVASIGFILIRLQGPSAKYYRYWIIAYYAVDFLCCVTMMVPVRKSIDYLTTNSKKEWKEGKRAAQKWVYKNFALALYIYVGFTRLGMFVVTAITSYKFWCTTIGLELTIEFLFYIVVYMLFWPNERYDYVVVEDRDQEEPWVPGHE